MRISECELSGPLSAEKEAEQIKTLKTFEENEAEGYASAEPVSVEELNALQNIVEMCKTNQDYALIVFNCVLIAITTKSDQMASQIHSYISSGRAAQMAVFYHALSHYKTVDDIFKAIYDGVPKK